MYLHNDYSLKHSHVTFYLSSSFCDNENYLRKGAIMRYIDKTILWISPVVLLINMVILASSAIIMSKDLSSFTIAKYSISAFSLFISPVLFILYVISIFNIEKNKSHSTTAMIFIMLLVILINTLTFPFTYHYFYKYDWVTILIFILSILFGLKICNTLFLLRKNLA